MHQTRSGLGDCQVVVGLGGLRQGEAPDDDQLGPPLFDGQQRRAGRCLKSPGKRQGIGLCTMSCPPEDVARGVLWFRAKA